MVKFLKWLLPMWYTFCGGVKGYCCGSVVVQLFFFFLIIFIDHHTLHIHIGIISEHVLIRNIKKL